MERLQRYAELVVRVGANVQPGQQIAVLGDIAHAAVAQALAEQAWRAGASQVDVVYEDGRVRRAALQHAPLEALTRVTPWVRDRLDHWAAAGAAMIRLSGNPDPHLFEGIEPARVAATDADYAVALRTAMLGGAVAWTIVAAPNEGWARQVFGEPDVDRLWEAVGIAMRLDAPDPVAAWEQHRDVLRARQHALEALDLDALRYDGPGTDLTVGLLPGAIWVSGSLTTADGTVFMPNLPTEEVFTSPDRTRADGRMTLTRPVVLPRAGVLVEGLVVTFESGRIVEVTADVGEEAVRAELATDDGARCLGEVALVDRSSAVRAAGVVFHDTLYDENAGSHVAWGQSFPFTVPDGLSKSSDELYDLGLNRSVVHTDVVIGGPGVSIAGIGRSGEVTPIITDDQWVLPTQRSVEGAPAPG